MALNRRDKAVLGAGAAFALLVPLALLWPRAEQARAPDAARAAPLRPAAPPPLAAAYARPLFGPGGGEEVAPPADAPQLAGIVGRLGQDAVALVRTADGPSRALRIGESVDGWQLASLAIDAAFFTRGAERVRVPLPAGE